jgi:hypothetical protein
MIEVVKTSIQARENNEGIFKDIIAPERDYINLIKNHGEEINDDNFALNALFFTTSLVHGDNTNLLFKRIAHQELIQKYDWIFKPKEVLSRSQENDQEVVTACFEFFRPGGYNSASFEQWVHNHKTLNTYQGDLNNYFQAKNNDASKIIDALVVKPNAKTYEKKEFRRFGPKLSRLFIQWVNQYDFCQLENVDNIGIPVDFQVCRVMIQTKAIELSGITRVNDVSIRTLLPELTDIFTAENINPRKASEAVWWVGSLGCNKKRHNLCPVSDLCTSLISREPYDVSGKFDPTDIGRFNI